MIEHDVTLVGMGFRLKKDVRDLLARSVAKKPYTVDLRRQPDNKYDPNAIAVYGVGGLFDEHHLGYLSRETAEVLAERIDAGTLAVESAKLTEVYKPDHKGGNVHVKLADLS